MAIILVQTANTAWVCGYCQAHILQKYAVPALKMPRWLYNNCMQRGKVLYSIK